MTNAATALGRRLAARLGRWTLATRIAAAMVTALVALQILAGLVFFLTPEIRPRLYSAAWVVNAVGRGVDLAEGLAPDQRSQALAVRADPTALVLTLSEGQPALGGEPEHWQLRRLKAMLDDRFGAGRHVLVQQRGDGGPPRPPGFGPPHEHPDVVGGDPGRQLDPPGADTLLFPDFAVAVRLADGTWLVAQPPPDPNAFWRTLRVAGFLAAAVLLVGFLAVRTARSLVSPLQRLASAAERLGRERVATPVEDLAIPEFAAIAQAFDATQARIQRFVDDRMLMLAAISHDLRTPLTRLRLLAEEEVDPARRAEILASIAEMDGMIRASLAFASEDAKREPHESVDLASLLISLADAAQDRGEDVVYEGPDHAVLRCAPHAIRRVFNNLLDNAVIYGGCARISLRDEPGRIVVDVRDEGPGIAPELVEKAFQPFSRLEASRNRETGGTGLGLAIVRDVVRGHGGEVFLANAAGGGLVATVLLPRPMA